MSERLAGEIRSALGQMNDDAEPVVLLVRDLVAQLAELESVYPALAAERDQFKRDKEKLEQQLAELRLQTTECNGFDCCPLAPELAALRERIHEACEVYAGMEGFIPVHAETGYVLQTIEQMYKELLEVKDE